jgi:pyridoxal phosphate enzyme (YggS family)
MSQLAARIAENLAALRERIATAAGQSGRTANDITLVAVTKYVGVDVTAAVLAAGCTDLGESRPQELWNKAAALGPTDGGAAPDEADKAADAPRARWHLVGHLQRNKIRRTLPMLHLLHSVDSRRLLDALDDEAAQRGRPVDVLLEANVSGDAAKTGLPPEQLESLLADAGRWPHVSIRGLMGMASLLGGTETAKHDFEQLRNLRDRLATNAPQGVTLDELSMGMSGDFEAAIHCGATIVRIGSALFEGLDG